MWAIVRTAAGTQYVIRHEALTHSHTFTRERPRTEQRKKEKRGRWNKAA